MTQNVERLKADIDDELAKLEELRQQFQELRPLLKKPPQDVPFYDRAAMGHYLHCFYNGCETIFTRIARFFENDLPADNWHPDLLKRMKLEAPGYRPTVIDRKLEQSSHRSRFRPWLQAPRKSGTRARPGALRPPGVWPAPPG